MKFGKTEVLITGVLLAFALFFGGFYIGRHTGHEQIIDYPNARYVPPEPTEMAPADRLVNINTADQKQLETLDGVGPAIAARIIEFREHTPFLKPADIQKVDGVGLSIYEKNKHRIVTE